MNWLYVFVASACTIWLALGRLHLVILLASTWLGWEELKSLFLKSDCSCWANFLTYSFAIAIDKGKNNSYQNKGSKNDELMSIKFKFNTMQS